MAKGNMLLGMARGSVGDVTFYRDGGLQRARARNRQPNNPRSNKQQTQRALFANCVKFYKLTAAKFFRFAFENKKVNESDYNAFMRENLKRGVMMSKTAFYCEPYPALGNWLMSRGSLATIRNANDDNTNAPIFDLGAPYADIPSRNITIGEISTAMVASGRYQVGDIITMIKYLANGDEIPSATPDAEADLLQTNFVFWQFLVDPNNTNSFISLFGDVVRFYIDQTSQGNLAISFGSLAAAGNEEWRLGYQATTIIHSRNTANGLLVSTQELTCNPRYTAAITTATTDATYKSAVLSDWQASGLAILQGEGLQLEDAVKFYIGNRVTGTAVQQVGTTTGVSDGDEIDLYIQFEDDVEVSAQKAAAIFYANILSTTGLKVDQNITPTRIAGQTANIYVLTSVLEIDAPLPNSIEVRCTMPDMTGTMNYTA